MIRPSADRTPLRGRGLPVRAALHLGLLMALLAPWQTAAEETYLLSLSAAPPPCMETRAMAGESSRSRCYGTQPAVTRLEMPADRIVYLDRGAQVPVEWLFVGPLFLRTDDLLEPGIGYRIRETDDGLRLEIFMDDHMRSAAVNLDDWVAALTPDERQIWVRVSRVN